MTQVGGKEVRKKLLEIRKILSFPLSLKTPLRARLSSPFLWREARCLIVDYLVM